MNPSTPVSAESAGENLSIAPDAVHGSPFVMNPALPAKTPASYSALAIYEPSRQVKTNPRDGFSADADTRKRTSFGVGWSGDLSSDLQASFFGLVTYIERGGGNSDLTYAARSIGARFGLEVISELSMGVSVQGQSYTVRQLQFKDGVTSDAKGYVLGAGVGFLWGSRPEKSLSIYHIPAARGSAEAEGEHRILAKAGLSGLDVSMPFSQTTWIGAFLRRYQPDDDADADPSMLESGARKNADLGIGTHSKWTGKYFYRTGISREVYDASVTADTMATRIKAAVGQSQGGAETRLQFSARAGTETDPVTGNKVDSTLPLSQITLTLLFSGAL